MSEKSLTLSDHIHAILEAIFIGDHNIWMGRLLLVSAIGLVLYLFLYYKGVKNLGSIFIKTFTNDFFYPIIVILSLLIFESFIDYYLNNGTEFIFYLTTAVSIFVFILVKKFYEKQIPYINVVLVLIIILIFCNYQSEKNFSLYHFGYELLAVLLIFITYFTIGINEEYRKANSEERDFWDEYTNAINCAQEKIIAINTENYSEFTESIGYRYFSEQLKVFANSIERDLIKQRFFIVSSTKSRLIDSDEMQSFGTEILSDETRNFKSLYIFHKLFNIEMYLVPIDDFRDTILEIKGKCTKYPDFVNAIINNRKIKIVLNKIDRLIVDDILYKPDNRNNSLYFEIQNDEEAIIKEIIIKFATKEYNIDHYKQHIQVEPRALINEIKELRRVLMKMVDFFNIHFK